MSFIEEVDDYLLYIYAMNKYNNCNPRDAYYFCSGYLLSLYYSILVKETEYNILVEQNVWLYNKFSGY